MYIVQYGMVLVEMMSMTISQKTVPHQPQDGIDPQQPVPITPCPSPHHPITPPLPLPLPLFSILSLAIGTTWKLIGVSCSEVWLKLPLGQGNSQTWQPCPLLLLVLVVVVVKVVKLIITEYCAVRCSTVQVLLSSLVLLTSFGQAATTRPSLASAL
jgi:hypothetical protein